MKKIVCIMAVVLLTGLCACAKDGAESGSGDPSFQEQEQVDSVDSEDDVIDLGDDIKIDFDYDYTENIRSDVDYVASSSSSLQNELKHIDEITKKYALLLDSAQTQQEMNVSSQWLYVVWDTELNHLWNRFCNLADPETKERVLAEQRNWVSMKDEVTLLCIGSREESGSIYSLLWNSLWEEKTKNRAYFLANELAKIQGEPFVMPDAPTKYGLFVDNQGAGEIYSSLVTRQGQMGEDEAMISLYRQGEIKGSFADNGNGELMFTSDDGSVHGMIRINGWDGAVFEVTEATDTSGFSTGEKFEFPFLI